MMEKKAPKRIATAILNSLKGGVVPRVGLEYIAVGRKSEIDALLHDVSIIEDGGAAFRFIVGRYGSGKSFLLQTMRNYVMEKGFVVIDADLSIERRLSGTKGQGISTYKELMQNMSTRTKPDGGALPLILERWISSIQSEVAASTGLSPDDSGFDEAVRSKIYSTVNELEGMVNGFDFARVILFYWDKHKFGDDQGKAKAVKWFRGEYSTKTEAKNEIGVNFIINDDNWYDFIKLFATFLVNAGYKGLLVMIDELEAIFKIPHRITRQYNYEKILTMYNDTLQGKVKHLGIIMGGTPQCIEDTEKGIFSYGALRSRLAEGRFSTVEHRDLLAPIIRLNTLSYEEMLVLIEKLAILHSDLYDYQMKISESELLAFLKIEYERIGADTHITPREIIRNFVEVLNIMYQSADKNMIDIISDGEFVFAKDETSEESLYDEFADFEV
ncbi:MAG: ATP-binding protein [Defluviitaleaceae bacterium]|nr:ATP-binding protein [Defluviitaleaceae bacterium]